MIEFEIDAVPVAQGRPRAVRMGNGVRLYDPQKSREYKEVVSLISRAYMRKNDLEPLSGALIVHLEFYFTPPKSYSKKRLKAIYEKKEFHTKKPDVDNLSKSVTDAMNKICYEDDAQIIAMTISKHYADKSYTKVKIENF